VNDPAFSGTDIDIQKTFPVHCIVNSQMSQFGGQNLWAAVSDHVGHVCNCLGLQWAQCGFAASALTSLCICKFSWTHA